MMIYPAHPGLLLEQLLIGIDEDTDERITSEMLAERASLPLEVIQGLLAERVHITPAIADALAKALPYDTAEQWLEFQTQWDEAAAYRRVHGLPDFGANEDPGDDMLFVPQRKAA